MLNVDLKKATETSIEILFKKICLNYKPIIEDFVSNSMFVKRKKISIEIDRVSWKQEIVQDDYLKTY